MTSEEVIAKIKNSVLEGYLKIKKTKVLVPMSGFNFVNEEIKTLVGLNAMIIEAGIRGDKKLSAQLKSKRQNFIVDKKDLYEDFSEVYFVLNDYLKLLKPEDLAMFEYDLGEIFGKYMERHQYESPSYIKFKAEEFFKYMPYLKFLVEHYNMDEDRLSQGYCCENCEGDYNRYISSKYFYGTIEEIKEKLKQIKLT